ncbi:MAG: hypothetical protein ABIW19_08540 [Vicinamibacterales bacterium]
MSGRPTFAQGSVVEGRWTASFTVNPTGINDAPAELVISVHQESVFGMLGDVQIPPGVSKS